MAVKDMVDYQFTSNQDRNKAAENGRKGGIASGKAKREKATFKKQLLSIIDEEIDSGKHKGKTYRELITLGQIKSAIQGKNENFRTILSVLGELEDTSATETPEITINVVDNSKLEKAMYEADDEEN